MKRPYLPPSLGISVLLLLLVLGGGYYLLETREENRRLRESIQSLESTLEQERQELQGQIDSLHLAVGMQEERNMELRTELSRLERQYQHLNLQYYEKQTAILRISDADSLYRELARHYGD